MPKKGLTREFEGVIIQGELLGMDGIIGNELDNKAVSWWTNGSGRQHPAGDSEGWWVRFKCEGSLKKWPVHTTTFP
jgi:hypothetical protein